jgi:glutamate formiminotransferase/formiminotetrahydrofolate cyclodeaminase
MEAFGLPKKTEEEKHLRRNAVQEATRNAIMIPMKVMETAFSGFSLVREMVGKGNPNSVTDAGVGALAICACIRGAFLNVKINAAGLDDSKFVSEIISKGCDIEKKAILEEEKILKMVGAEITRQSRN